MAKIKGIHQDFQKSIVNNLGEVLNQAKETKKDLEMHINEFKGNKTNNEFQHEDFKKDFKRLRGDLEQLRVMHEGKLEQIDFELGRKILYEDIKQNFKTLNDILAIKFKQLEDTKEAVRHLICY